MRSVFGICVAITLPYFVLHLGKICKFTAILGGILPPQTHAFSEYGLNLQASCQPNVGWLVFVTQVSCEQWCQMHGTSGFLGVVFLLQICLNLFLRGEWCDSARPVFRPWWQASCQTKFWRINLLPVRSAFVHTVECLLFMHAFSLVLIFILSIEQDANRDSWDLDDRLSRYPVVGWGHSDGIRPSGKRRSQGSSRKTSTRKL